MDQFTQEIKVGDMTINTTAVIYSIKSCPQDKLFPEHVIKQFPEEAKANDLQIVNVHHAQGARAIHFDVVITPGKETKILDFIKEKVSS